MNKKIYVATVEISMFVYAKSQRDAEDLARDHAKEEMWGAAIYADEAAPGVCEKEDSLPWGGDGERTVAEIFAEQLKRKQDREEAARIEANQLKLFGAP